MKPAKIYTTRTCMYCFRAKDFLQRKGVEFEEVDVSDDDAARKMLVEKTGQRTVPQIWIGETHVGGYTDMVALEREGKLTPLLDRAKALTTPAPSPV